MLNNYRDTLLLPLGGDDVLIMACDSCGAIGTKEHDVVKVSPYIAGKYTARVALMEVLSLGAKVKGITVNICNELDDTGSRMLEGIKSEIKELSFEAPIIFSTEKNIATSMTALGVTVVGVGRNEKLLLGKAEEGDLIYVVGKPKVGNEVVEDKGEIANTKDLMEILNKENIKEVIPVGSLGIKGELDKFLEFNGFKANLVEEIPVDIHKSAGPCTTIIVICRDELELDIDIPYFFIESLVKE